MQCVGASAICLSLGDGEIRLVILSNFYIIMGLGFILGFLGNGGICGLWGAGGR